MSNEYLDIAIEKVVKQEINKVLGQIRTEISAILTNSYDEGVKEKALQIIDKYKGDKE